MNYSIFILIAIVTCWSSTCAGHSSEEKFMAKLRKLSTKFAHERSISTNDLEEYFNEELKKRADMEFMANFLLEQAEEHLKPALKKILDEAIEARWPSMDDFKRYVLKMYRKLKNPTTTRRKRSQFKREISEDFDPKIIMKKEMKKYTLRLIQKVKPSKRHLLKKELEKAQKIKWTNIEKFKVYCDQILEQYLA